MSRWWRAYDEAVDDPKLQRLSGEMFKAWFNLMCLASQNNGVLPDLADIAFKLRVKEEKAWDILDHLGFAGLIDRTDGEGGAYTLAPHNWNGRQYKSDVSTERVKRFRKRGRNVSETPPETEVQKTETDTEANASGADAPDVRTRLFRNGLQTLAKITGKTPDSCRATVGKWLKSVNDEAIHVLGAIEDAERNRIADPVAWINQVLKSHQGTAHGQASKPNGLAATLGKLREHIADTGRSDEGGQPPPRLLSHG